MIELANCEWVLLREIADQAFKQRDVAQTYALTLRSSEEVDWAKVNRAIIERWSIAGLNRIKGLAWSGKAFQSWQPQP